MRPCSTVHAVAWLLAVSIFLMAAANTPAAQIVEPEPFALYSFDAGAGGLIADLSGSGIDGTIFGAQWVDGRFGQALQFDGVDDYVQAVGHFPFSRTNAATFAAWIKVFAPKGFGNILSFRNCCQFRMLISPGLHPFYDAGSYVDVEATAYRFDADRWHHYALVVNGGGTARVYIDGRQVSDAPAGVPALLPDVFEALYIGGGSEGSGLFFSGRIDEVRIYDSMLTEDQVKWMMGASTTDVLNAGNERLLAQLQAERLDAHEFSRALAGQQDAAGRGQSQRAQELAFEARQLALDAIERHRLAAGTTPLDLGRLLFVVIVGVVVLGALTAVAIIWRAWKGEEPGLATSKPD